MSRRHAQFGNFLDPGQLVEFTRFYARECLAGQYPLPDTAFVDIDADERWHQRIYRDRRIDIWLISTRRRSPR